MNWVGVQKQRFSIAATIIWNMFLLPKILLVLLWSLFNKLLKHIFSKWFWTLLCIIGSLQWFYLSCLVFWGSDNKAYRFSCFSAVSPGSFQKNQNVSHDCTFKAPPPFFVHVMDVKKSGSHCCGCHIDYFGKPLVDIPAYFPQFIS